MKMLSVARISTPIKHKKPSDDKKQTYEKVVISSYKKVVIKRQA